MARASARHILVDDEKFCNELIEKIKKKPAKTQYRCKTRHKNNTLKPTQTLAKEKPKFYTFLLKIRTMQSSIFQQVKQNKSKICIKDKNISMHMHRKILIPATHQAYPQG